MSISYIHKLARSGSARLKERLLSVFRSNPCFKLIDYQGTNWKISLSVDAPNLVAINLKELSKQIQELTPATNHAKLLDDYQFILCKEMERWVDDTKYIEKIRGHRIIAILYICRLAEIIEQIKVDATNQGLKREVVKISKKMTLLIDKLEKSVLGG
jgi:hypothetical protein